MTDSLVPWFLHPVLLRSSVADPRLVGCGAHEQSRLLDSLHHRSHRSEQPPRLRLLGELFGFDRRLLLPLQRRQRLLFDHLPPARRPLPQPLLDPPERSQWVCAAPLLRCASVITCVEYGHHESKGLIFTGGWDNVINIWSVEDKKLVLTLKHHTARITELDISPDGQYVCGSVS